MPRTRPLPSTNPEEFVASFSVRGAMEEIAEIRSGLAGLRNGLLTRDETVAGADEADAPTDDATVTTDPTADHDFDVREFPQCFGCGYDYLVPETLARAMGFSSVEEMGNYGGASVAAARTGSYIFPVTLTTSPTRGSIWGQRTSTVLFCQDCTDTVRRVLATGPVCEWCSARPCAATSPLLSVTRHDASVRALTSSPVTSAVRLGRGVVIGTMTGTEIANQSRGVNYRLAEMDRVGRSVICQECLAGAYSCDNCATPVPGDTAFYCEECEEYACTGCERNHRHGDGDGDDDDGDYDSGRGNFRARATVHECLAQSGTPGTTVISTRAVGIEIESARGHCAPVIAAEVEAPVPVLAAVGTDGSVRGARAVEFRLLPQRGVWVEYALRSMAAWCTAAGYRPDTTAGIHMHLDCSELTAVQVWRAYATLAALEDVIYAHAMPARRSNDFCRPWGDRARVVIDNALANAATEPVEVQTYRLTDHSSSRYCAVNIHSYPAHQTIEVRAFDSSHTVRSVVRFTDAAAILAAAVDYAASAEFSPDVVTSGGEAVLAVLVEAGLVSAQTHSRATRRLHAGVGAAA